MCIYVSVRATMCAGTCLERTYICACAESVLEVTSSCKFSQVKQRFVSSPSVSHILAYRIFHSSFFSSRDSSLREIFVAATSKQSNSRFQRNGSLPSTVLFIKQNACTTLQHNGIARLAYAKYRDTNGTVSIRIRFQTSVRTCFFKIRSEP